MRVCASACGFSIRTLGMANGMSTSPMRQLPIRLLLRVGREDRDDGRRGAAMQPGRRLACIVQTRFEPLHRDGVEVVVGDVVLAGPGQLDRLAVHRLGDERRLDHVVRLGLAAEAAAEQRDVDGHVLGRDAEARRQVIARGLRRLHAGPGLALAVRDLHHRRRRLHGRVREMRDVVFRLDALGSAGQRLIGVAVVAHDHAAGLAHGLLQRRLVGFGGIGRVRAVGPTRSSAPRGPSIAAQVLVATTATPPSGWNTAGSGVAVDGDDLEHARHLQRLGIVERLAPCRRAPAGARRRRTPCRRAWHRCRTSPCRW